MLGGYDPMAFVATTDPARARAFYERTLGLKFVEQTDFAVVFETGGIMLRVTVVREHAPAQHTVLGWKVPDIGHAVRALAAAGIAVERYPFLQQDEAGIWTSPAGGAKVAWFKDPDGNILSLAQS